MQNALYYLIPVLIWGSTWLAIKFQLGIVAPELSIAYRFTLAAILLFIYSGVRRLPLRFTGRQHAFIALQALLLFSLNYILVYLAEGYLTSGLVAIIFSMNVIANVIFGAVFLGSPVRVRVVLGAVVGILGIAIVFYPELSAFDLSSGGGLGLVLSLLGVGSASLGDIVSARNQKHGLPVIQTNAFGMAYGAAFMFVLAGINGAPLTFDPSFSYVTALLFLAMFGSVIAFGAYLTLLGRIGADRAAYVTVLFPVISLSLSTLFEGMTWSPSQLAGVVLVVLGNVIVLTRRRPVRVSSLATGD
jgi:drug/metabolite transporter (DMT)-like permease